MQICIFFQNSESKVVNQNHKVWSIFLNGYLYNSVCKRKDFFFTFEHRWQAEFLSVEKNDTNFRKDDKGTFLFSL